MGRTFYDMARESVGFGVDYDIRCFIDDNLAALNGFQNYPPILSDIHSYMPEADDLFVCSIGGASRRKCMESILERGGHFLTMIHRTARLGSNVQIGEGTVIGAYTTVGADACIGCYNLIQSYTVIGHDAVVGNWNRIDTHVTMVGGTRVEDEADIYTAAVLNHGVVVGSGAKVAACSFVISKVKAGTTVMGNPARVFKF